MKTGTVLKLELADDGLIFYQITTSLESTYAIKPLCKVRKGFLTIRYRNASESHIYRSEVGVNYLVASQRELNRLKEIMNETVEKIDRAS